MLICTLFLKCVMLCDLTTPILRSQEHRLVYLYLGVYKNLDRVIFLLSDIFKIGVDWVFFFL